MTDEEIYLAQLIEKPVLISSCFLKESDFTELKARRVYHAINKCVAQNLTPDIMTLIDVDPNLSPTYLAEITDFKTTANWKYYHDKIKEVSSKRKLRKLGEQLQDETVPLAETLENIEMVLMDITDNQEDIKPQVLKEIIPPYVDVLERRYKSRGELPGIEVTIQAIGQSFLGFQRQNLYYIGARPSQGKSALLLNFAVDALKKDYRVGYLSAESSKNEVLTRIYAQEGKMDSRSLLTGYFGEKHFREITNISSRLYDKQFIIYDKPNMSLVDVRTQARYMKRKYNIDILFLDYVQIITEVTHEYRRDQVGFVSMALKGIARELDIPVVAAAQLRRDAENRKPTMADFSDSSQLEKDADGVIMIYHKDDKSYLCIEKARDGETGDTEVYFKKEYTRFFEKEYSS